MCWYNSEIKGQHWLFDGFQWTIMDVRLIPKKYVFIIFLEALSKSQKTVVCCSDLKVNNKLAPPDDQQTIQNYFEYSNVLLMTPKILESKITLNTSIFPSTFVPTFWTYVDIAASKLRRHKPPSQTKKKGLGDNNWPESQSRKIWTHVDIAKLKTKAHGEPRLLVHL